MTVKDLIKRLEEIDQNKMCVHREFKDGIGWANLGIEEKKAIENIKEDIKYADLRDLVDDDCTVCFVEDLETILNLLDKQDNRIKELEADNYECNNIIRDYIEDWKLKTKIIDLMAEHLTTPIHSKKDVIEYFENLAKGECK